MRIIHNQNKTQIRMATWKYTDISINGRLVKAQAPIIVSASRSTDIPAFYTDWFFKRLEIGYSAWTNPFNGVKSYVSYDKTRFIVFWSKNPRPSLITLTFLKNVISSVIFSTHSMITNLRSWKKFRPWQNVSRLSNFWQSDQERVLLCGDLTP